MVLLRGAAVTRGDLSRGALSRRGVVVPSGAGLFFLTYQAITQAGRRRRRRKIFRRKRSRSLSTGSTTVTADCRKVSALRRTRNQAQQQRQVSQQPLACARPTSGLETKLSAVKETAFSRASQVSPSRETEIREDAVRETAEDGHATESSVLVHSSRTNQ